MLRAALIACSKRKIKTNCLLQAKWLYQGALFKKALKHCKFHYDKTYILSAKYGLLSLEDKINFYDLTLNNFSKEERKLWANKVTKQLHAKGFLKPNVVLFYFAGKQYREFLPKGTVLLEHLGIGKQLQYFKNKERGFFNE